MRAPEFWQSEAGPMAGLAAGMLAPLGVAWDAAGRLRRAVARPYRAPVPVVCVGNLVAGGAGKTPVALALAAMFRSDAVAVHIVSRGYGGYLAGPLRADPAQHDAAAIGDEALLLAACAPCWVARDRAAGVRAAVDAGAAAILLDDGLQNPGVAKNLSFVVVDAEYGFGNGRVIPAGPLRETIACGLARADAIVVIGIGDGPAEVRAAGRPVLRADLAPVDGGRFAGARVIAFAGIARPEKFFATLRTLGAEIVATHAYPDHYPFADREIARLNRAAATANAVLVTTAKDWVRLAPPLRDGIAVLDVEIAWRDPAAPVRLLADAIGARL